MYKKRKLSISQKLKNVFVGVKAYIYRRADIYELEKFQQMPYYLDADKIKITAFKEAFTQYIILNQEIKDDFIKFDIERSKKINLTSNSNSNSNLQLQETIYPMYYGDDLYQQHILTHVTHNAINCPFMSNQRSIRH